MINFEEKHKHALECYEKAYKEALKKLQNLVNDSKKQGHIIVRIEDLENVFTEIKENEDEKIRNFLIDYINHIDWGDWDFSRKQCIAWLEKQGQQKPINKVKPKFKVGDWAVQGCNILKIRCVGDEYYCYETVGGHVDDMLVSEIDSLYHLWTIQDAKDGDVLVSKYNKPFIYNGNYNSFHIGSYCGISVEDRFIVATEKCQWTENANIHPATKEQRDLLFQKMKEAGYEWDAEKKGIEED